MFVSVCVCVCVCVRVCVWGGGGGGCLCACSILHGGGVTFVMTGHVCHHRGHEGVPGCWPMKKTPTYFPCRATGQRPLKDIDNTKARTTRAKQFIIAFAVIYCCMRDATNTNTNKYNDNNNTRTQNPKFPETFFFFFLLLLFFFLFFLLLLLFLFFLSSSTSSSSLPPTPSSFSS